MILCSIWYRLFFKISDIKQREEFVSVGTKDNFAITSKPANQMRLEKHNRWNYYHFFGLGRIELKNMIMQIRPSHMYIAWLYIERTLQSYFEIGSYKEKVFGFAVKKLSTKFWYSQNEINFHFVTTAIVKAFWSNRRLDPGGLMSRTGKPHSGPTCPKWTHCSWSVLNVRARAAL